jgi:hypothetical protein
MRKTIPIGQKFSQLGVGTVGATLLPKVINVPADYPTTIEANRDQGRVYTIGGSPSVTDNDATKTNTNQTFLQGQEIMWNGISAYFPIGNDALFVDTGTAIKTLVAGRDIETSTHGLNAHANAANPHSNSASATDLNNHEIAANPHSGSASTTDLTTHTGASNPHSGSAASGSNSDITELTELTVPYLTVVASDSTLIGDGTSSSPLSVVDGPVLPPVLDLIDLTTSEPASPSVGDRYINLGTGTTNVTAQSVTGAYIYEWNGTSWTETIPIAGDKVWVISQAEYLIYNGSSWQFAGDTLFTRSGTTGVKFNKEGDNLALISHTANNISIDDDANDSVSTPLEIIHSMISSADPVAAGIGVSFPFYVQSLAGSSNKASKIDVILDNVSNGNESSYIDIFVQKEGSLENTVNITAAGITTRQINQLGANASLDGPHKRVYTDSDSYPLLTNYNTSHDNISLMYDTDFNGTNYVSSDVGSNFLVTKFSDKYSIYAVTGVTAGNTISSWGTPAFEIDTGLSNTVLMERFGARPGSADNFIFHSLNSASENYWLWFRSGGSPRAYNGMRVSNFDGANYWLAANNSNEFFINYGTSGSFASSSNVFRVSASATWFPNAYGDTVSGGTTLYMKSDGQIGTSTSLTEAKTNIKNLTFEDSKWLLNSNQYQYQYKKTNKDGDYINVAEKSIEYGPILEEMQKDNKNLVGYFRKKGKMVKSIKKQKKLDPDTGLPITIKEKIIDPKTGKPVKHRNVKTKKLEFAYKETAVFEDIETEEEVLPVDKDTGRDLIEDDLTKPIVVKKEGMVPHLIVLVQELYRRIDKLTAQIEK